MNSIATALQSVLVTAGSQPDALVVGGYDALAGRAERLAASVEGLDHPPRLNTRLRDLGSALNAVAVGLGHLSTAAGEHHRTAVRVALATLRADAQAVRQADAALADALR